MHKRFNYVIKFIVLQGATKLEQQYLLKSARSLLFWQQIVLSYVHENKLS